MKNAQNEIENSAEKLVSNPIEQQPTSILATTTSPIVISTENVQNNNNNVNTAGNSAATTAHTSKMTDEHSNGDNTNEGVNNNNNRSSGSSIIAEAAKILLKNGLNGTSAAAALFTAAQTFQLPTFPAASIATSSSKHLIKSDSVTNNQLDTSPINAFGTTRIVKPITMASAVAINDTCLHNNGMASPSSFKVSAKDLYNTASSSSARKPLSSLPSSDTGAIDCTIATTSNGAHKTTSTTSGSGFAGQSNSGGRLQFFKDGKFILELARSKDGERGGWVSVPRRHFRSPSTSSSTVTPASTTNACLYPKIENSTSLSFSDDNSSIQSSPWQREHWKQATPKRNISKEMSLYYQRPQNVALTVEGHLLARSKRRRPYNIAKADIETSKIFQKVSESCAENKDKQKNVLSPLQNGGTDNCIKIEDEDRCSTSSVSTLIGGNDDINDTELIEMSDTKTETSSKSPEKIVEDVENVEMAKPTTSETLATNANETELNENNKDKENQTVEMRNVEEKINTSEDNDDEQMLSRGEHADVDTKSLEETVNVVDAKQAPTTTTTTPTPVKSKTGVEYKRLNKKKIDRAKLTTIVQKLIDQMPTRVSNLLKTPSSLNSSSSVSHQINSTNFISNKVSPTSSSSTSPALASTSSSSLGTSTRLVEYHQQHVSPRKRILREFEKVSLDDNLAVSGGKRSRAKNSANSTMNTHYRNARSPNNRVHSSVCSVPVALTGSTATTTTTTSSGQAAVTSSSSTNGESGAIPKSTKNTTGGHTSNAPNVSIANNTQQTRVYSSYSIHSLLGDSSSSSNSNINNNNSNNSNTSGSTKSVQKSAELLNAHLSSPYQHHSYQNQIDHLRKSVSPKSPDTAGGSGGGCSGGGKSPLNTTHKKRSPPYSSSPIHETISKSPSVSHNVDGASRATPTDFKQRYLTEQQHQQQHSHYRQIQQGAFYSPYMMSPKYIPGSSVGNVGSSSSSTRTISPPPMTTRSPRHASSSFSNYPTTSTTPPISISTTATHNIPHTLSSHLTTPHSRELSPTRSLASSPRETTPVRTVPKKTASIRRQFASPTSSGGLSMPNNSSCPSPGERIGDEFSLMDSKSPNASAAAAAAAAAATAAAAAYQQMLQRQSPLHAASYYMYPPSSPMPYAGSIGSSSNSGATAGVAPTTPTPTSPYIPTLMPSSYYHSYISALNITKHYYMGAGASLLTGQQGQQSMNAAAAAAAAARLSPPFPHLGGIPYNGVMAAAAAAAAAFSGQPSSSSSPSAHHHTMLPPPAAATAASLYGVVGNISALGNLNMPPTVVSNSPSSTSTATTASNRSIERNMSMNMSMTGVGSHESSLLSSSIGGGASGSGSSGGGGGGSGGSTSLRTAQHSNNLKDEQSSDVPLNLSKH